MQLSWCDTPESFNALAADVVVELLARKPAAAFALPTGKTPMGLYAMLRARAAFGAAVSWVDASWFDLDEYVGVGATHPLSYAGFVRSHLLKPLGVPENRIRLLQGDALDLAAECRNYEQAIEQVGGIDLAILGLGANGHIAFNEPGSSWEETTHVVELSAETRAANSQLSGGATIPLQGVTMGIATLRRARGVLLLVAGESKRNALQALRRGVADAAWPVTSLLGHPNLTVVAEAGLQASSTASTANSGAVASLNANDLATNIMRKASIGAWRVE
jgi:glucosamine-6-phosphate deaminase